MCGIAGFLSSPSALAPMQATLNAMLEPIAHRGPDDAGTWVDADAGIALGHRRLSIIDLSPAGHQPMVSADGRYALVMNGEIYNHKELRRAHEGYPYRGHSDTEVALAVIQKHGVRAAMMRFVGMFAFAIWDAAERALFIARDRLGEKPIYYGRFGADFLFGSELKALRAHPAWRAEIDRDSLALLLQFTYVPSPGTIYSNVNKLPPGCILRVAQAGAPTVQPYWSASEVATRGLARHRERDLSPGDAVDTLERLLQQSISQQMMSDVPIGAFLSGGIDSSLVVALMQSQSSQRIKTFSIGFHEERYNEAHEAKRVAEHLGTDHTELYVSPEEARAVIPRLPTIYDEPFADSSQIPTFLVSQLARTRVTVALSGDGGDELFAGYSRYARGRELWQEPHREHASWRRALAAVLSALPYRDIDRGWKALWPILPRALRRRDIGDVIRRHAAVLRGTSRRDVYAPLITLWRQHDEVVLGARPPDLFAELDDTLRRFDNITDYMTFFDLMTYLPDDILTKVDRASMAMSLEVRVPFLDHRVVEFALGLPTSLKVSGDVSKWILRQVLYRYVPPALVDRPKMGFGVPIDSWLRHELRPWAEDLLSEDRLRRQGFFAPTSIRQCWEDHLAGRADWHYVLWPVLMFQAWYAD